MSLPVYSEFSLYYNTPITNNILGIWVPRTVPSSANDQTFIITAQYEMRPDLLAHNLYGDSRLWWVFSARNPNTLLDPLGNFLAGTEIYLPDPALLKSSLGL